MKGKAVGWHNKTTEKRNKAGSFLEAKNPEERKDENVYLNYVQSNIQEGEEQNRKERWPKKSWEEGEIGGKSREEEEIGSESREKGHLLPCSPPPHPIPCHMFPATGSTESINLVDTTGKQTPKHLQKRFNYVGHLFA